MQNIQADLFAQDNAERNRIAGAEADAVRAALEAVLARLEASKTFPWAEPLDAVHEENRFERRAGMLGEEGAALWARFDKEMDRLYATRI